MVALQGLSEMLSCNYMEMIEGFFGGDDCILCTPAHVLHILLRSHEIFGEEAIAAGVLCF